MTIGKGKRPRDPQSACKVDCRSLNKRYTGAGSRRSSGIPPQTCPSIWLKSAGAADKLAGSAALLHTWPDIVVPQGRSSLNAYVWILKLTQYPKWVWLSICILFANVNLLFANGKEFVMMGMHLSAPARNKRIACPLRSGSFQELPFAGAPGDLLLSTTRAWTPLSHGK